MNEAIAPELRFPEFDDAWRSGQVQDFGSFYYGTSAPKWSLEQDAPTPCVRYGELYTKFGTEITETSSRTTIDPAKLRFSKGGEVLVPRVGEKPMDFANCAHLTLPNIAIGEMISVFETDQSPSFFANYFNTVLRIPMAKVVEGASVSNLYYSYIQKLHVKLPTLAEQEKIAAFFSAVDDVIASLEAQVEDWPIYKRGLMQALFSQDIRFKADDGSDFPDWREATLRGLGKFEKGRGVSKGDVLPDGTHACIRYGELYTDYGMVIEEVISRTSDLPSKPVLSHGNDVLIPSSGEVAEDIATASAVMVEGVVLGGDLNVFRTLEHAPFLAALLSTKYKYDLARLAQGNSVVHLYGKHMSSLKICIPSLPEQRKIADALSALDAKIDALSDRLEHTRTFKRGLLQKMFV